jgi:transcriptional regulator with XRE-family HTH domain
VKVFVSVAGIGRSFRIPRPKTAGPLVLNQVKAPVPHLLPANSNACNSLSCSDSNFLTYLEYGVDVKISIPGLGGRLQRARKGTGLSQTAVATKIGVSWMTVHRWERSQRGIPDRHLGLICDLYDKPLRWFLTLEEGDLDQENVMVRKEPSAAADSLFRKIADAPASYRPMIEKVVDDLLDSMRKSVYRE